MTSYNFFKPTDIENSKVLPESLVFKGGSIDCSGGLLVDAQLTNVTLDSKDGSPIYVSALATLDDCVINGTDVLMQGHFSGTLNATGKVEFASGCVVVGIFNKGGEVYMHMLSDLDNLKISSMNSDKAKPALSSMDKLKSPYAIAAASSY
jgi:hypothetical protein